MTVCDRCGATYNVGYVAFAGLGYCNDQPRYDLCQGCWQECKYVVAMFIRPPKDQQKEKEEPR